MLSIIETDKLTKVFKGDVRAVDGIDFEVKEGEIFGFLGPNGAGKTTTIKMLNTLIPPTSGSAKVAGYDIVKQPSDVRTSIGYVAQDVGVDEHSTGRENLTLYGHFYRLDKATIKQRIAEIFKLVDLEGYEDKMAKTYSGGMRKRLDLAMGLIHNPKLVFMDEPTTGLDPQTRSKIWEYIRKMTKELGITIFLTTHYLEEADQLCNRVAIIDLGKIITTGTPSELKSSIGGDVINLSPGKGDEEARSQFMTNTQKVLEGESFVQRTQPAEEELAVYVDNAKTATPAIMRILAEKGIDVETLSISRPSLDDVFLKYTGKTIRHQEGKETSFTDIARRSERNK
ncbi:MAG: ATP-binding cassette domain-containing protein [Chloroflexi bacterium]|nr:ATP-binding cassette domain-containing protein [Chloroflexota bacterium]MBT7082187.1 ATP-binding cassette domain-containing protein [Chloroflexota bacterium]MBT7289918.1 ATP-binding cassette domain-containing protein [Chloroflexota bacterium]